MKQTPEIVIPAKQISYCGECHFFREQYENIHHSSFRCVFPSKEAYIGSSGYNKMETKDGYADPDDGIWIHCPLPDVEQGDKE